MNKINKILFLLCVLFISCGRLYRQDNLTKADLDTAYEHNSGINSIILDSEKIHRLTNLGMLWGFIKYYHANVRRGNYNMDAELFRILPNILKAKTKEQENKIFEQWVDHFGMPDSCRSCVHISKDSGAKFMPNYGNLFERDNLPLTLIRKLEFIKFNTYIDSVDDYYYSEVVDSKGELFFNHECEYEENNYPDAGVRLLTLFRYWNQVQYFFPYRHQIGENWNNVLREFIPVFCSAADNKAYAIACLNLTARIHDSHGVIYQNGSGARIINAMKGSYSCPFSASFIEGKLVITKFYPDSIYTVGINQINIRHLISLGDIIDQINFVPVDSLTRRYLPLINGSNYTRQLYDLASPFGWLLTGETPEINLRISRDGYSKDIKIARNTNYRLHSDKPYDKFKFVKENIGYINPANTTDSDLEAVKNTFKDSKGLIIDMRFYPQDWSYSSYSNWLNPRSYTFVKTAIANLDVPGLFEFSGPLKIKNDSGNHYAGKLIILVDERTISKAEYITMELSTIPGAIVLGSTTAGADGNVVKLSLPGGFHSAFSGIGIFYPDGTETQRNGIKINKVVRPTIKSIREGRDELLEEAIRIINNQ